MSEKKLGRLKAARVKQGKNEAADFESSDRARDGKVDRTLALEKFVGSSQLSTPLNEFKRAEFR